MRKNSKLKKGLLFLLLAFLPLFPYTVPYYNDVESRCQNERRLFSKIV